MRVAPLHKGKGDRYECNSYREFSLSNVAGKVLGPLLVKRIKVVNEGVLVSVESFRESRWEGIGFSFTIKNTCIRVTR